MAQEWSQFRMDATHSGYNPKENQIGVGNVGAPQRAWTGATGADFASSPAVVNGVAYVGAYDGELHAFAAASGSPLWTAVDRRSRHGSPAVVNGVAYVRSRGNSVRVRRRGDHRLLGYSESLLAAVDRHHRRRL